MMYLKNQKHQLAWFGLQARTGQVFDFQPGLQALWVRSGQAAGQAEKKWPVGSSDMDVGEGKVESVSVNPVMGTANEVDVDKSVLSRCTHIQILTYPHIHTQK